MFVPAFFCLYMCLYRCFFCLLGLSAVMLVLTLIHTYRLTGVSFVILTICFLDYLPFAYF